jgi:hypothetical protein
MSALTASVREPDVSVGRAELDLLAATILDRHRAQVRELRIEAASGGVVIRGRSTTYYGKQVVLHEVLKRGLIVVANDLLVAASQFGVAPV